MKLYSLGVLFAFALSVTPVQAGLWSQPAGDAGDFTYSNGQDVNGLYGEPLVFPNQFVFSTSFVVNASGGAQDTENDIVSWDAIADPGLMFSSVTIEALGSYAITGDGSVDLDIATSIDELGGLNRSHSQSISTFPSFPATSGNDIWFGSDTLSVTSVFPNPHNTIHFEISTDLIAITGPGGSAQLNVQFESIVIELTMVPEPASLGLLSLGSLLVVCRRRRRR